MTRTSSRCLLFIVLIFLVAVASLSLSAPAVAQDAVTLPAGTALLVKIETLILTSEAGTSARSGLRLTSVSPLGECSITLPLFPTNAASRSCAVAGKASAQPTSSSESASVCRV